MKLSLKRKLCAGLSAVLAVSLCGCSAETAESSFDNPLPWGSYEKLVYDVAVYDTTESADEDKRVRIADGELSFEINERREGTSGYIYMDMSCTFDYLDTAPEPDAGLTDTISSHVEFEMNSLTARYMEKTVKLADRDGQSNRSYALTADYHAAHKATYSLITQDGEPYGEEHTMALPTNNCRDNEMMFLLARAQAVGISSSTNFKMVNIFDSFRTGSITEYRMLVSGGEAKHLINVGDWVKDFGVEATETTEDDKTVTSYPVSCYYTTITINAEQHGPPYVVMYSEKPFVSNGKEHGKIPVKIMYSLYNNTKPYRHTEYTLKSCSFDKQ